MMDYNTSRKKLTLPEYGRNIQKLVEHAVSIEDRDERNKVAKAIISILGNMNPHLRDISDFKHKLWDHIAIMSDFKLDIDYPYEPPSLKKLTEKPKRMPYNVNKIKFRHYGRTIEKLIEKACEYEEGEEKEALIKLIANHMKKLFVTWNKETINDDLIISDLVKLSNEKLNIDKEMKLTETKEIIQKSRKRRPIQKRK